jgi:DNA-binding NarL/FixJ family response regulator
MLEQTEQNAILTTREQEIALLAAGGLSNKAIASELKSSVGTVKVHMHNIFQRLNIKTRCAQIAVPDSFR